MRLTKILIALMLSISSGPAFAVPVTWTFQNVLFSDGATLTGSFTFDEDSVTVVEGDDHPFSAYYQVFYLDFDVVAGNPPAIVTPADNFFDVTNDDYQYDLTSSSNFKIFNTAPTVGIYLGETEDFDTGTPLPPPPPTAEPGYLQTNLNLYRYQYCLDDCYRDLLLDFAQPLTNAGGVIDVTGQEQGVFVQGGNVLNFDRTIVSGQIVASNVVPIPAAVWLFGAALASLGWMRRKQSV